jgi:hypothetical protein
MLDEKTQAIAKEAGVDVSSLQAHADKRHDRFEILDFRSLQTGHTALTLAIEKGKDSSFREVRRGDIRR